MHVGFTTYGNSRALTPSNAAKRLGGYYNCVFSDDVTLREVSVFCHETFCKKQD